MTWAWGGYTETGPVLHAESRGISACGRRMAESFEMPSWVVDEHARCKVCDKAMKRQEK